MKPMPMRAGQMYACQLKPSGRWQHKMSQWKGILLRAVCTTPLHPTLPPLGVSRRCMATCGNGPKAPTHPIRTSSQVRGRSGNIMESSCATSTSCAAALALPPFPISGPLTATSFLPAPNGNSWVFDLQGRCNIHRQRQSQLELYDFEPRRNTLRAEVLQGLQDARKELPSKY